MNRRFMSYELKEDTAEKIRNIKIGASVLLSDIEQVPDCREKTIAIEKLEECVMWVGKAAASHQN